MKNVIISVLIGWVVTSIFAIKLGGNTIAELTDNQTFLRSELAETNEQWQSQIEYGILVEKELIQAWTDICLFKTDADMSDDYDAQYKVCECVVANDMDKLAGGGE